MKKIFLSVLALSLVVFSCSNDDFVLPEVLPLGDYQNGILVVGEGGFTTSGTVSFISEEANASTNDIFFDVNEEEVGSFFQSIGFINNLAYLVVDNGTIHVVNRLTFEKLDEITTGLSSPRYITFANGKGYVSNWGDPNSFSDDFIAVINLTTNQVEATIPIAFGPEQLLVGGNTLFVSHKGAFGTNNLVSVINILDNSVETITLLDKPDDMVINSAGELVVLSEGATLYDANFNVIGHTDGAIQKINEEDNSIIATYNFPNGTHPSLMTYSNDTLYYMLNNNVYSMSDSDTTLPTIPTVTLNVGFAYGMAIKDNMLYVNDASFSGQSEIKIIDLSSGLELNSFQVGLGASKIYFN